MNIRDYDIRKVNSLTKYPSIQTYHEMQGGVLGDNHVSLPDDLIFTEKIDGANSRIIITPDHRYIIGSRDALYYGQGDILVDYSWGIVEILKPVAERILEREVNDKSSYFSVFYFETFGSKGAGTPAAYTEKGVPSCRLFDIASIRGYHDLLSLPIEKISQWREANKQDFLHEGFLQGCSNMCGVPLTPRIKATKPPCDIEGTLKWLEQTSPSTLCRIDETGKGFSEGVVVRSPNREVIVKIRFSDYRNTIRKRNRESS